MLTLFSTPFLPSSRPKFVSLSNGVERGHLLRGQKGRM